MRFSWQDLNDGVPKRYWLHGRAWIGAWSFEWSAPGGFRFSIGINGGDGNNKLHGSFAFGLFSLFWDVRFYRFKVGHWSQFQKEEPFFIHEERGFYFSWHDGALWLLPWGDPMGGWSREMPWHLVTHSFNPMDFIFGRMVYSEQDREKKDVLIPMPEGCYPATSRLFISRWKRSRWPWWPLTKTMCRVQIDVPNGIPVEGKGENSWDCGEDATFGTTCPALTHEEGISKLVGSMLRNRQRYGGKHQHRGLTPTMAKGGKGGEVGPGRTREAK